MGVVGDWKACVVEAACLMGAALAMTAAPFGRVTPLGGRAADLAVDEERRSVYVANFTANRIDVVSLDTQAVVSAMPVAAQPNSLALSRDGRWLVVTHFGNAAAPAVGRNAVTVIDLRTGARQVLSLGPAPLGVAFGADGLALIVTATEFLTLDPAAGTFRGIGAIENLTANTLPRPPGEGPPAVTAAAMGVSGDGLWIYCLTDTYRFRYEVTGQRILALGYTADPPLGPRAVSVNHDGSFYTGGWGLFNRRGTIVAQFQNVSGLLDVGSHAIDSARGVIYAHVPEGKGLKSTNLPPPVLQIVDASNLAPIERIELPENLAGRSVLRAGGSQMISISDSGVMFLPVGALDRERRVTALEEDLIFRTNGCDRRALVAELRVIDASGQATEFRLKSSLPGLRFSAVAGTTPAVIRVTADPAAFPQGAAGSITIESPASIRIPDPVRAVVQIREPDQRGTPIPIPGKLADLLADPIRERFYVLRQDRNQVLVYDGATYARLAILKTGQTPWQMATTLDRKYLLIGNDGSQIANVYDLDTLEAAEPITFPGGHYPRSIAASGRGMLAAVRVAGPKHKIDRIDFATRQAAELPSLGVWENDINVNTILAGSPNGASILAAQADGHLLLYDASADTFTISRRDVEKLGGAYAASGFAQFAVGNVLLNASLVTTHRFSGTAAAAGFAYAGDNALRLTLPGVLERVDAQGQTIRPTRIAENPVEGNADNVFSRSLAILPVSRSIVGLTATGVTILPSTYDAATAPPRIERVVSSADGRPAFAPGALVSVYGANLSPLDLATREMPLPTALGESCLTLNGATLPMIFVSPGQINAQLPHHIEGSASLLLRTPGGVSNLVPLSVRPTAPSVFQLTIPGLEDRVPAIYNARNGGLATGSNPVRRGDSVLILLTGMGRTSPEVPAGSPAPADPPAEAVVTPRVSLGGHDLGIRFAGLVPGAAGLYQIQASVPWSAPLGLEIPLEISQGGESVTAIVRVIDP